MGYLINPSETNFRGTPNLFSETSPVANVVPNLFNVVQTSNNIILTGSFLFDTTVIGGGGFELDFSFLPINIFDKFQNFSNIVFSNGNSPFVLPSPSSFDGQILIGSAAANLIGFLVRATIPSTDLYLQVIITLS